MPVNRFTPPADSGSAKPRISEKARQRPVRVLPSDDRAEMEAGHIIGGPRLSSNITRSDTDAKDGFGAGAAFLRPTAESADADSDFGGGSADTEADADAPAAYPDPTA